jgi:hypothetical protein
MRCMQECLSWIDHKDIEKDKYPDRNLDINKENGKDKDKDIE